MYVVLSINRIRPEHLEEFLEGVRVHAANSAGEPGCMRYEVLQDTTDPHTVCLYEVFRDEAAFQEHLTYGYYKEWMERSREWRFAEQRVRHVLDYVYPTQDGPVSTRLGT